MQGHVLSGGLTAQAGDELRLVLAVLVITTGASVDEPLGIAGVAGVEVREARFELAFERR